MAYPTFFIVATLLIVTTGCSDESVGSGNDNRDRFDVTLPQSYVRELDLLIVVDDSDSMLEEQALLSFSNWYPIVNPLKNMAGGLPNIHIGVTSTSLGSASFQIATCEEIGGDRGDLLTGMCVDPQGANFIVDEEPTGCTIEKEIDSQGGLVQCTFHDCDQSNCDEASAPLFSDASGCPRCRNYDQELGDAVSCLVDVGTAGCEFEQPLEAMVQALDDNPNNAGFLREHAYLGIVFLTDEDDCSVSDPRIFDPAEDNIDSPLGPLSSYRCFELGVSCDINDRTHVGLRQGCMPREDPDALLHPISRYVQFLEGLKDPGMLAVAAIAGPVEDRSVTVGSDAEGWPEVRDSCDDMAGRAKPGIRLRAFVEAFTLVDDMAWAYKSICSSDPGEAFIELYRSIEAAMEFSCLPAPPAGCVDVAVEFGRSGDGQGCNDVCLPDCVVTDVFERGTANEQRQEVPHCLEVMSDGTLRPGNTDRAAAYELGRPSERDAGLPVSACWHVGYQARCERSNYAQLVISRRADPPPLSFAEVSCARVARTERFCDDGLDNDGDCLIDAQDSDCQ